MAWARRGIAYGEQRDYPLSMAVGHEFLAEDMTILGLWQEALEHAEQDRQIGERLGAPDRVAWAIHTRSHAFLGLGDLAAGVGRLAGAGGRRDQYPVEQRVHHAVHHGGEFLRRLGVAIRRKNASGGNEFLQKVPFQIN